MKDSLLHSLVYVSRYYGLANSPDALIEGLPLSDGSLTPFLFTRAAERAGLSARENRQDISDISPLLLPVVLLLKGGDSCVLLSFNDDKDEVEVVLPQADNEKQWIKITELNNLYTGRLFLLKKAFHYDERSPEILKTRKGHWFWSTIWQSKRIYKDVVIASILINLFAIASPLFTRIVYDRVLPNLAFESLWVLASGVIVIVVFNLILRQMRGYFIDLAGKKSDILLSSKIFAKVMGVRMEAKPASVGAFARHLQEFETIREFFTSATVSALIDLPFAIMFLLIIYMVAGSLVLIPIVAVCGLIIYSLLVQRALRNCIEEGSRLSSQKNANLIESLSGLETIKIFGAQSQFQYKWEEAVAHMANWGIKTRCITDSVQNGAGFVQQFVSVGLIVYGIYLIADGDLTMGGLIATNMLSGRAIAPLIQLSLLSTRYNQAKSSLTIIESLMQMPSEQEEGKHYIHRPIVKGKIELDKVTFNYPDEQKSAIRDVSLTINPGEKVAIIGRIGCGKTTLQRLIMGLYRPTQGSVRLDDTDISQLHSIDVRRNIGCVPQDLMLFFGSVRDNITLGRPLTDDRDLMDAVLRAGVNNFTQNDPAGLDKQIGERGALLSGGQRQAVCIARAFLNRPPILLFDEPTSNMDNRTEHYIKQQLKSLHKDETLILITHKTGMIDLVDRLIIMEQGHIVADGPKQEVINQLKNGTSNTKKANTEKQNVSARA